MLLQTDTLELLAEVSIALAGFSGVALMLGRRSSGRLSSLEKRRLSFLLELTLGVFFLSVLPLVGRAASVPDQLNLRACATALLAFKVVMGVLMVVRDTGLSEEDRSQLVRPSQRIAETLLAVLSACLLVVILGAWARFAMSIYLASLTALLLTAAFQFYHLLRAVGEADGAI
jgi:hypothetical protein